MPIRHGQQVTTRHFTARGLLIKLPYDPHILRMTGPGHNGEYAKKHPSHSSQYTGHCCTCRLPSKESLDILIQS